jgi:hypothetical protein
MFRPVGVVALVVSLTLAYVAALPVAAEDDTDSSVSAESSVASLSMIEGRLVSESSVLLFIGIALLGASRAARR